jgi:hypothetical protein
MPGWIFGSLDTYTWPRAKFTAGPRSTYATRPALPHRHINPTRSSIDCRPEDVEPRQVSDTTHALNQGTLRRGCYRERDSKREPCDNTRTGRTAQDHHGQHYPQRPHDQGTNAGQQQRTPEDCTSRNRKRMQVILAGSLRNLARPNRADAHGCKGGLDREGACLCRWSWRPHHATDVDAKARLCKSKLDHYRRKDAFDFGYSGI